MSELDPLEREILNKLTFEETYKNLVDELSEKKLNIVDRFINSLVEKDYVKAKGVLEQGKTFIRNEDNLKTLSFIITSKGLDALFN